MTSTIVSEEESFSASLFETFDVKIDTLDISKSVTIHGVKTKGTSSKPPLLLVHGHPQTHLIWRKVAPALAQDYQLIIPDLRGQGGSSAPSDPEDTDHELYSKRSMAQDFITLMKGFGFDKFYIVAHDRGARASHRLALDHPSAVIKLVILDIIPTLATYAKTTAQWASLYFHWFFLIQKAPLPENMISGSVLTYLAAANLVTPSAAFSANALAAYHANIATPARLHASCEDYRASAPGNVDLRRDAEDIEAGRKIPCDTLVLYGEKGVIGRFWDVQEEWGRVCAGEVVVKGVPTGHFIPEEMDTDVLVSLILDHLKGSS